MLIDPANPNQLTGIACFALAAAACTYAARRGSRAWRALAWTNAAFCLEIVISGRHRLHDFVDDVLRDHGWYAGRTPWQIGLLVVVAALALVCLPPAWRGVRGDRLATIALAASLVVAMSMMVEAVSLHAVDAWLYAPGAVLLPVVFGWIVASTVVVGAALGAGRR
jgi:hypothetical protein